MKKRNRKLYSHGICKACGKEIISQLSPKWKSTRLQDYCSPKCRSTTMIGQKSRNSKGGSVQDGYKLLWLPGHRLAQKNGYVLEHRLLAEKYFGIELSEDHVVHHINHDRSDNRAENLMVLLKGDHTRIHMIGVEKTEKQKKALSEKAKVRYKTAKICPATGRFIKEA